MMVLEVFELSLRTELKELNRSFDYIDPARYDIIDQCIERMIEVEQLLENIGGIENGK